MDYDDIYPRLKFDNEFKKDYEVEIPSKRSIFNKVKLLPSGNERNFKETSLSIETIWKFSEFKNYITSKLDALTALLYSRKKPIISQNNIEIQTIKKNNIIKNISIASKKLLVPLLTYPFVIFSIL